MAYQLPDGLDVSELPPATLEALAVILEKKGSLPFVAAGVPLAKLDTKALAAIAEALDQIQIAEARQDPAAFVQYCFLHEETNAVIVNAPHHKEWHEFLNQNDRAILFAPVEHAKTQHVAIGRTIWILGKDPNKRLAIVSNTAEPHATKLLNAIRTHIESNPRVHKVFPELKPSKRKSDPWGQSQITVQRDTIAKDPSIQSLGCYGPINGSRLDGIILDDLLNYENTRTPEQINKLLGWLDSEVFTRVTHQGFVHWIGTPWNPLDPMHEVAKRVGWKHRRYQGIKNPEDVREKWIPLWPEQFSVARLGKIYDGTTPINFARKYLCQVRMDSASRFQMAWIDHAKQLGRHFKLFDRQPHTNAGTAMPCFTGVDLGIGQGEGHDLSTIFTIALDETKRKIVCEVQAGRWTAPEIVGRIHSVVKRYNSKVFVEDNAAQAFLLQWAQDGGLPISGFTTTAGKKYDEHFGIESMAVEMRNGGWVIPSSSDGGLVQVARFSGPHGLVTERVDRQAEVEAWIQEMLMYTPDSHTGDRLMASWLARECARMAGAPMFTRVDTVQR